MVYDKFALFSYYCGINKAEFTHDNSDMSLLAIPSIWCFSPSIATLYILIRLTCAAAF